MPLDIHIVKFFCIAYKFLGFISRLITNLSRGPRNIFKIKVVCDYKETRTSGLD